MVSNDDFDGKATNLNCFYLHINFEQKYPKPAVVRWATGLITMHTKHVLFVSTCLVLHVFSHVAFVTLDPKFFMNLRLSGSHELMVS